MADIEKVIKGLRCCLTLDSPCGDCPYYSYEDIQELDCERNLRHDVLTVLKEQESWINEIAEYQQSISGSGMHELDDYEKGKWDGLQIAWNIISEGR